MSDEFQDVIDVLSTVQEEIWQHYYGGNKVTRVDKNAPDLKPACAHCGHIHEVHDSKRCWWNSYETNLPCTCRRYVDPREVAGNGRGSR